MSWENCINKYIKWQVNNHSLKYMKMKFQYCYIPSTKIIISIYTLSDLGDLSNLIGSLSRTIQQYSPPSKWIMCELGVFPTFFRERSFKSRQNPWVDFF